MLHKIFIYFLYKKIHITDIIADYFSLIIFKYALTFQRYKFRVNS